MNRLNIDPEFEALLEYIKNNRGFDFTGYKRSSLMRRVNKRMQTVEIETYNDYLDYLQVHQDEFIPLFNTLLINVTCFFRDREAWDYIGEKIVPLITANKEANEPIRVWSAACASGEEAYTLAMVLAEALGVEQFKARVKIYATELDEDALAQARQASYTLQAVGSLSPEMLDKYFERCERGYSFRKDLRRTLIFGRNNLTIDAPISRIDLLVCRNALMYFNAETQAKILNRFHFALREGGFLFLGKAEMLVTQAHRFIPVDLKLRVFTTVPKIGMRDRLLFMADTDKDQKVNNIGSYTRIREAAFDNSVVPQIVVNVNGFLMQVNERARAMFGLKPGDLGRPLQDLEISYRPVELRSCIEQAYTDRRPVHIKEVEWRSFSGELIYLEVLVSPLVEMSGNILGVAISFTDVSRYKRLQDDLQHSSQELEMAYEELQSTNEELETTNEELQSSNEELETTNEELQSSNEELETMNEELQSTNEELQALNDEMRRRTEELNQVNAFLEAIFTSLRGGIVVVNQDLYIQIWNYKAEDLWGLRVDEVQGQHFLNLDIGLPVEQLKQCIRRCLSGESDYEEVIANAINRRGKAIACKVTCTPLVNTQREIQGAILVMEEQEALEASERMSEK
ncbi:MULTISPECIES: CheR family methyltransferase [Cyanophyceae]|uniref:CheR family methyltransferase n=1 Tax=Cyanophyceae TaxID=3028117 RepID=UPI001689DF21|nr:CheR family methyltransferase [Trichocoleus sp. FACHB-40]MBD2006249.1 PAS domain S-box protein [Trichocoleus sp. FACHB-40]